MLSVEDVHNDEICIWACESRNSDNIMVIIADKSCCDQNNMFNDKAWESAKYFSVGDYDSAVSYAFSVISKQYAKSIDNGANYSFSLNRSMTDLEHIIIDAEDLEYEDYYDLATFEDIKKGYLCDLIINEGKVGLRYSKIKTNDDDTQIDNLIFKEWDPDLASDMSLMLGMSQQLRDFINAEIDYDVEIGKGI